MAYFIEVVNGMLAKCCFKRNILADQILHNLLKWFCYRAISIDPD
jgi:hypothetical protein